MSDQKKTKIKVYVVGSSKNYANFLLIPNELVDNIVESDIVIFTGGEDVYPDLYYEPTGSYTRYNADRDFREREYFKLASKYGKLIIGICRGAQFATVFSGGHLIQDVSGHANGSMHQIQIVGEKNHIIDITSTHHQMMYPFSMNENDYVIIAHTPNRLSSKYLDGYDMEKILPENFVEPEIVYYTKTNALAIQGHPEMMNNNSKAVKFINQLIHELLETSFIQHNAILNKDNEQEKRLQLNNINLEDLEDFLGINQHNIHVDYNNIYEQ